MPTINVSEATPVQLNYLVATIANPDDDPYSPTTDWSHGGPIIDQEGICIQRVFLGWAARGPVMGGRWVHEGETALIAAMRYYVTNNLGPEVDVPDGI